MCYCCIGLQQIESSTFILKYLAIFNSVMVQKYYVSFVILRYWAIDAPSLMLAHDNNSVWLRVLYQSLLLVILVLVF